MKNILFTLSIVIGFWQLPACSPGPEGPMGPSGPIADPGSYADTLGSVTFTTTGTRAFDGAAFVDTNTFKLAVGSYSGIVKNMNNGNANFQFARSAYADEEFNFAIFSIVTDPSYTTILSAGCYLQYQRVLPGFKLFNYNVFADYPGGSGADVLTITGWQYDESAGVVRGDFSVSGPSNSTGNAGISTGSFQSPMAKYHQ